ncbi:MAG: DUF2214 family protein [Planctomycetota bacterium]|jgi:putative membrane protein|nr:DUF2214 family protein [Planctomycetota bacterium]
MVLEALIRAAHFIGIMALYGALLSGHLMTARELPRAVVRKIAIIDLVFWFSVVLVLATGLVLWFGVGKEASYYLKNGLFHGKLTLFVVLLGLGVKSTLFWRRNRIGDPADTVAVPGSIKAFQGVQLLLLVLIPILAALVARGVGGSAAG